MTNPSEWERELFAPAKCLEAVWGDGAGGLWAAGDFGQILRRTGPGKWTKCSTRSKGFFSTLHGRDGRVVVAGSRQLVISTDGVRFKACKLPLRSHNKIKSVRCLPGDASPYS